MSPESWPPRALVALAKLWVPARMLAAVSGHEAGDAAAHAGHRVIELRRGAVLQRRQIQALA